MLRSAPPLRRGALLIRGPTSARVSRTRCIVEETLHRVRDTNWQLLTVAMHRDALTARCPGVAFHANGAASRPIRRNAMTVSIRQLHPHFFGEVTGVDLRKPLTSQEAKDIEAGMDKYAVLLFRDQEISDEQQMAFALNFAERENPPAGNILNPQAS